MGKILKVKEIGDPKLYQKSTTILVDNIDNEIIDLIEDLKETLNDGTGFGIAAPQIGINKRIIIIQVNKDKCHDANCEDIPLTVLINPTWRKLSEDTNIAFEGCLSVPSIRGKVERYNRIEVTYYNRYGQKVVKEVTGFTARLIQHECDHLDGILFIEKVVPNGFATTEMIKKFELEK